MTHEPPFDAGLQPERTLLAWRRTALALALGSLVGLRFTLYDFGPLAVAVGVGGTVAAAAAYVSAAARYRRTHRALVAGGTLPPQARAVALLAIAALLVALAGAGYLLTIVVPFMP
ncbi:DUF202 domain-containing protein [Microbacterium sp. LRZ72]|uniref:DUF202 domain-containing protein n=1 Tax=Microbacterium sp. LRZ72 TaxID=2942481 RepID=UPI0029AC6E5B|nr:DUF202 domain-containing protein [Microbacterium sp. LRZ72]MDX2376526.1 DUF202 domain-containing protein [Microbacterium sp. LRZ72]